MVEILIGIDYGKKRSGVAELNTNVGLPKPVGVFENGRLVEFLHKKSDEFSKIVVGLPLNLNGRFTEITFKSVGFAEKLMKILEKKVFLIDERLSSAQSKWLFKPSTNNRRFKDVKDMFAASLILESFFKNRALAFEVNMNFDIFPEKLAEEISGKNILISNKRYKIGDWVKRPKELVFQTKDPYYFYILNKTNLKAWFCDLDEISNELLEKFDIIL